MKKCAPRWFQITSRLSRRPIGVMCVLIFRTASRGSQNSSVTLSQVMNHGFWSMTPRQNAIIRSGTLQTLPVPRKWEWANPKSNRCPFFFFFLSSQGIIHKEFVPTGQTVNQTFYREVLERLRKRVAHVCDQALHALGCCTMTTSHVTR